MAALRDIKVAHTLFALPMAITGMLLATGGAVPSIPVIGPILLCMVAGRSAAMGLNRLVDARLDRQNPRTLDREIPSGRLSPRAMGAFVALCGAAFLAGASLLNALTLTLAPLALLVFVLYPYTKRFTALCHAVLGLALGAAPVGAWIAVRGSLTLVPVTLGLAVALWVSGFDILYALQDVDFDRATGLHSAPVALGRRGARRVSRLLYLGSVILFATVGVLAGLGPAYAAGVAAAALLLVASQWLVREDLGRIDAAFFTTNSWLSIVVMAGTVMDLALR